MVEKLKKEAVVRSRNGMVTWSVPGCPYNTSCYCHSGFDIISKCDRYGYVAQGGVMCKVPNSLLFILEEEEDNA